MCILLVEALASFFKFYNIASYDLKKTWKSLILKAGETVGKPNNKVNCRHCYIPEIKLVTY